MAHFRGIVQGARGQASRLGHRRLETVAQAWGGQIVVVLWRETLGDTPGDYVCISVEANGAMCGERVLYYGPLSELRAHGLSTSRIVTA